MEKTYFLLKLRTKNGAEYWSESLYSVDELSEAVANLLSLDVFIIGIKHLILD